MSSRDGDGDGEGVGWVIQLLSAKAGREGTVDGGRGELVAREYTDDALVGDLLSSGSKGSFWEIRLGMVGCMFRSGKWVRDVR